MIKAIIFDMDGVIIDSEPLHIKLERELFKNLGLNISHEEHLSFVGSTSHYMWDAVKNKYNLPYTVEELVEADRTKYLNYISSPEGSIKPIDGVNELIKELHSCGLKLAVASSSPIDVIELVVKTLKLDKYFDVLVTGDYVDKSKPEPDIFLYAANKLGVKPDECVVIEDSYNGVQAAKKAGMKIIGFINPNSGKQDLSSADLLISSFKNTDILHFIDRANDNRELLLRKINKK